MSKTEVKQILVALDISGASKKGLDTAISLAKLYNAKITCVTILVVYPTLVSTVVNYEKYLRGKAEKMLETTKEYCEKQEIQYGSKVLRGNPSTEITKFAHSHKMDMIVIGSKGLGGIKGKLLGSVVNSVVHESKVSVLVIK